MFLVVPHLPVLPAASVAPSTAAALGLVMPEGGMPVHLTIVLYISLPAAAGT